MIHTQFQEWSREVLVPGVFSNGYDANLAEPTSCRHVLEAWPALDDTGECDPLSDMEKRNAQDLLSFNNGIMFRTVRSKLDDSAPHLTSARTTSD